MNEFLNTYYKPDTFKMVLSEKTLIYLHVNKAFIAGLGHPMVAGRRPSLTVGIFSRHHQDIATASVMIVRQIIVLIMIMVAEEG